MAKSRAPNTRSLRIMRSAALIGLAWPALGQGGVLQEYTGTAALQDVAPWVNGAGVIFGQAEADNPFPNQFEVNPANVYHPSANFFYINDTGQSAAGYPNNIGTDAPHADFVGDAIYGGTFGPGAPAVPDGIAYGLTTINSYSSQYIITAITNNLSLPDNIINQSFRNSGPSHTVLKAAGQAQFDSMYDNYVDNHGTLFISAGGSTGVITSPGTAYNSIGVGMYAGGALFGPTIDNGRAKPDIVAVASVTSIATGEVSGAAALIYQSAGTLLAGSGPNATATDPRTIKALLMNGAVKMPGWHRTYTQPIDFNQGAGVVNAYNSYQQLMAGKYSTSSITNPAIGGPHPANNDVNVNSPLGWDFSTLTTGANNDSYRDYVVQTSTGLGITGYDLTATLVWNRPLSNPNSVNLSNAINNLYLYLYDVTADATTPIDYSVSPVDNVQHLYDQNLTPGHVYDIEVLKRGGALGSQGVLSNSESYALAFNFLSDPNQYVWVQPGGGSWTTPVNWANDGVPDGAGAAANLGAAVAGPFNVTLDGNHTVGQLVFSGSNSYTLSAGSVAGSTLILDAGAKVALINVQAGSHTIAAPLQLNSQTLVSITSAASTLAINAPISGAGSLSQAGSGTLILSAANSYAGPTNVSGGNLIIAAAGALPSGKSVTNNGQININAASVIGSITGSGALKIGATTLQLAPASGGSSQGALAIAPGGLLDITDNSLTLNYGGNPNPGAIIRGYILSAYGGPTRWSGTTGITSTLAAADPAHHAVGYADGADGLVKNLPAGSALIAYTFAADINLDGKVDFSDFILMGNHFGTTGSTWDRGDLNYDGKVDFQDFIIFSNNMGLGVIAGNGAGAAPVELAHYNGLAESFGFSGNQIGAWDTTIATLPEPACAGVVLLIATGLLPHRRSRRRSAGFQPHRQDDSAVNNHQRAQAVNPRLE